MIASLKKLYSILLPAERIKLIFLLALMVIGSLLEMIGIGSVPAFIYFISSPEAIFEKLSILAPLENLFIQNPKSFYILLSVLLILLFAIKNIFLALLQSIKTRFSYRQQVNLGNMLFKAYLNAPWSFHLNRNSAETLRNVNNEVQMVINQVLIPFLGLIMDVLLILLTFLLLFIIEPLISLFALIISITGAMIFLYFTTKKLKDYGSEELSHRKKRNKIVLQALGGLKELQVYQKTGFFLRKYHQSALKTARAQAYKQITYFLPRPFLETFAITGVFVISLVFVLQNRAFDQIIPVIALFGTAAVKIIPAVKQILSQITQVRFYHIAVTPIFDDLKNLEKEKYAKPQRKDTSETGIIFQSSIELKSIDFKYPEKDEYVLKGFSLKLEKGKHYSISGISGAGKTTLLEIITGIIPPDRGEVLVDGKNIQDNINSWHQKIGYVPQNNFLYDDTVENNIAIGEYSEQIDDEKLKRCLNIAQLEDFIGSLPQGVKTRIGERGVKISGGQRQRIGIARALYREPEVLILDEATSEIEREMENHIIFNVCKKKNITLIRTGHKRLKPNMKFKEIVLTGFN